MVQYHGPSPWSLRSAPLITYVVRTSRTEYIVVVLGTWYIQLHSKPLPAAQHLSVTKCGVNDAMRMYVCSTLHSAFICCPWNIAGLRSNPIEAPDEHKRRPLKRIATRMEMTMRRSGRAGIVEEANFRHRMPGTSCFHRSKGGARHTRILGIHCTYHSTFEAY